MKMAINTLETTVTFCWHVHIITRFESSRTLEKQTTHERKKEKGTYSMRRESSPEKAFLCTHCSLL